MSVTLRYEAKFHVDEQPTTSLDLVASAPNFPHRISYSGVLSGLLNDVSTVAIADCYSDTRQLSAGTYTLDLTSLISTLSTTKVFTGQKVKGIIIAASSSNTAGIVVTDGASNGYQIFGSATGETTVYPGCVVMQTFGNNLAAISSSLRNIAFSSSDADAEFQIILVVGV